MRQLEQRLQSRIPPAEFKVAYEGFAQACSIGKLLLRKAEGQASLSDTESKVYKGVIHDGLLPCSSFTLTATYMIPRAVEIYKEKPMRKAASILALLVALGFPSIALSQYAVHDAPHTAVSAGGWGQQASDMVAQLSRMLTQIENQVNQIENQVQQINRMDINLQRTLLGRIATLVWQARRLHQKISTLIGDEMPYSGNLVDQYRVIFPDFTGKSPSGTWTYEQRKGWNTRLTDTAAHTIQNQAIADEVNISATDVEETLATLNGTEGNLQALQASGQIMGTVALQLLALRQQQAIDSRLAAMQVATEQAEERLAWSEHLRINCPTDPDLAAAVNMPGCEGN